MKIALDILTEDRSENFASNNGAHTDTTEPKDHSFEIALSVSKDEVHSKKAGETVNDFSVKKFDSITDRERLETILRTHNYSTNVWKGSCSNDTYFGMYGVTRDFDGGLSMDEAREMFADVHYVLITSARHMVNEDGAERFRIIFPFAHGMLRFRTGLECRKVYHKLNELYPEADANCSNPGRKYFPSTSEFGAPFLFEIHVGKQYFDIDISGVPDEAVLGSADHTPWNGRLKPRSQMQRILKYCPFVKSMIRDISDAAIEMHEPPKYGLITILCWYDGGAEELQEILGKDPRPNRLSPAQINAKIKNAMKNGGPMSYAALIQRGWAGPAPDWTSTPTAWAYHVEVNKAVDAIVASKGEDRKAALRRFFHEDFHLLSASAQTACLVDLVERGKIPEAELRSLARDSFGYMDVVDRDLKEILPRLRSFGTWPEDLGAFIFRWFTENGGKCYRDKDHVCYLVWKDKAYEIGPNQPYHSLLWEVAHITDKGVDSAKMLAAIKAEADLKAKVVEFFTWLHTDANNHILYLHQNRNDERLIQVDRKGVRIVPNGNNEHEVILTAPTKMKPADLVQLDMAAYQEAWREYDRLILRNMASSRSNQLMAACWSICYPLMDYVKSCPHLRFEGRTKRGKTRAMDLIGYFVYGEQEYATSATTASIFSNAAVNPLFMYDNLETKNITQEISDLLLTVVSGGQREKRDMTSAHGVIVERTHCLACTTGIENLNLPEQINRTLTIPVDHYEFSSSGWSDRMYELIKAKRPEMFTAHMMLLSRVLSRIANGEIETRVDWIQAMYPTGHDKDRVNSYLSMMALVAEELLPIIEPGQAVDDMLVTWIKEQDETGAETARESSPIVVFLEAMHKKARRLNVVDSEKLFGRDWPYSMECKKGDDEHYTMRGTGAELLLSFGEVAREKSVQLPFNNAQQLARRLNDAKDMLKDRGIIVTSTKNREKISVYTFEFPAPEKEEDTTPKNTDPQVKDNEPKPPHRLDVLDTSTGKK